MITLRFYSYKKSGIDYVKIYGRCDGCDTEQKIDAITGNHDNISCPVCGRILSCLP